MLDYIAVEAKVKTIYFISRTDKLHNDKDVYTRRIGCKGTKSFLRCPNL